MLTSDSNDTVYGMVGNDIINGNDGADTLFGRMVTARSLAVLEQTVSMLKPVVIPLPAGQVMTLMRNITSLGCNVI